MLCSNCKEKYIVIEIDMVFIECQYGYVYMVELNIQMLLEFYCVKGCEECGNMGYKGRIGVYELLGMMLEFWLMVYKEVSVVDMKFQVVVDGMCIFV